MSFSFEVLQSDPTGARRGKLTTPHGVIETPVFMPVGTLASVKGVPQDTLLAYMLFSLAADQGNEAARGNRVNIVQGLSLKQIEKVSELARQWRPGKPLPTDNEITGK